MIALLLAAATPLMPPATPVTIKDVRRDPRKWDGKWVNLEGVINVCRAIDCHLSEGLDARQSNWGMGLSFESQPTFDKWAAPMLPMRARVTARIDATCLIEVCLDRAPVLREMIVEPLQTNLQFPDE